MYKLIRECSMPKWLKFLLNVLLTLTCIYWIGMLIFKILNSIRAILHYITEKRNWWTFIICIIILLVGSFLIAQFWLGLDPCGKFIESIKNSFENGKQAILELFI